MNDKESQCIAYDMRLSELKSDGSKYDHITVANILKQISKSFVFQLEKGELNDYMHFQIKCFLIKKKTKSSLLKQLKDIMKCDLKDIFQYIAPSVTTNLRKLNYVMKNDTRIDGPWSDKDNFVPKEPLFIPKQYEGLIDKLYPYQQHIWNSSEIFEPRLINIIVDLPGCNGKSSIASLCEIYEKGIDMPPMNDCKEIIQMLCNDCMATNNRDPKLVLFDMPRALSKERLAGFFAAIEQIKKGKLYDPRHHYKKWWIHSPQIWVFTNELPDLNLLSKDRWIIWNINANKELIPFTKDIINEQPKVK